MGIEQEESLVRKKFKERVERKEHLRIFHEEVFQITFEYKPVSINQKYINRKFVTSKEYKGALAYMKFLFATEYRKSKFFKPREEKKNETYSVHIWLTRTRIDIDNAVKPILDALEKAGVIYNDSKIDFFEIQRDPQSNSTTTSIGVWALEFKG